jgi:thiopeptide-type bacteriocin biosynthesis protein
MKLHPQLLIRIPQLKLNALLATQWEELKASIAISSADFYEQIKEVSADDLDGLPRPVYHTIWKYFNRAKYRATPYGSFAGCGVVSLNFGLSENQKIEIAPDQILHRYPCWSLMANTAEEETVVSPATILLANSSCYQVGAQIRFLIREDDTFQLAETPFQECFQQVLKYSMQPATAADLLEKIPGSNLSDLQEMVDLQLLLTENIPNIIGQDYFERIGFHYRKEQPQYVLAERKIQQSTFSGNIFKELPALINLLATLVPSPATNDLESFKTAFRKKFEYKTVPLMEALDPEIGLGYAKLDAVSSMAPALEEPPAAEKPSDAKIMVNLLFSALMDSGCKVINLENLAQPTDNTDHVLPASFAVLCSVADDLLIVEQIAAGANRLLGRFSLLGNEVEYLCKSVAAEEASNNPDVLFFDIGHTDELVVDNVNRRKTIYPDQLPLLNFNGSDVALYLHDLDVTLSGTELILYDRRRNKRVVPRLSSGYNYKRSDLAVYRFLCDLQYDGLKTNFSFKLPDYFPNKKYYPRVQYKHIILSPAQWRVSRKDFLEHSGGIKNINTLATYLKAIGLDKYATTRTEDRTMCFDLQDPAELRELLHIMEKFENFSLEEGLFLPKQPLVQNKAGEGYANQFVVSLINDQKSYSGLDRRNLIPALPVSAQPVFLPAHQWLYFEIYSHPLRADWLLKSYIEPLMAKHADRIKHWFFIRYGENGPHLRLRLKLHHPAEHAILINELNNCLMPELKGGIVSDLKICTYKPEIERYGADLIEKVEAHFCIDSLYMLQVIGSDLSNESKYALALHLLMALVETMAHQKQEIEDYINQVCTIFTEEYQLSGPGFKDLNKQFKQVSALLPQSDQALSDGFEECKSSAIHLLNQCEEERKVKLMADIIHMHVNRLFTTHQRSHELLIYYFAQKMMLKQKAFAKKN